MPRDFGILDNCLAADAYVLRSDQFHLRFAPVTLQFRNIGGHTKERPKVPPKQGEGPWLKLAHHLQDPLGVPKVFLPAQRIAGRFLRSKVRDRQMRIRALEGSYPAILLTTTDLSRYISVTVTPPSL